MAKLADDLFHGRYEPQAPKIIHVPKANKPGQTRQLGILTIRDRVVQTALKQLLEPLFEPTFAPTSFGFRPGRSVAGALAAVTEALSTAPKGTPKFLYAVPLDIADCFPTLDHDLLRAALKKHLADAELLRLLDGVIHVGGQWRGRLWWQRLAGLVQGGSLSPLLCNLALHPVDEALARLSRNTQGGVQLFRYADDLLLLARDPKLAQQGVNVLKHALAQRHQKLKHERRPQSVQEGFEWLGVQVRPRALARPNAVEFGYAVPTAKIGDMVARLVEMTAPPSDKIDAAAFNLGKWIVSINQQLRDWRQVYVFADNAPDVFRVLDDVARERVAELFRAVTGVSYWEMRRQHMVRLPRGFWTWEVPGARLSVLSALAPCAPAFLTRRPLWMREGAATRDGGLTSCDV